MIFDIYADKNFDEDVSLIKILGGQSQLFKYARSNLETGLSEF